MNESYKTYQQKLTNNRANKIYYFRFSVFSCLCMYNEPLILISNYIFVENSTKAKKDYTFFCYKHALSLSISLSLITL